MACTTQCNQCGVVLNVPDHALGKRLKCPKCGTKFGLGATDQRSAASSFLLEPTEERSFAEVAEQRPPSSVEALPTVSGDVRETFDATMRGEAEEAGRPGAGARAGKPARSATATASKPIGDAQALFEDEPKPRVRRPNPAEARKQARRCPTCSTVVPVGMSLCSRCGLDLESGTRVSLDDDLAPPPPPPPSLPLSIGIIGGICLMSSVILTITTLSLWFRGYDGFHYFVPLCAFGIFAAVQFLRLKSTKLLLMALTFGLAIDVIALIAMPIYRANSETGPVQRTGPLNDPDQADMIIPSVVDKLDSQSLAVGIGLVVLYAGVSVYLISPQVRRHFR